MYCPHIDDRQLVGNVFVTPEVPDIFFQLLTQHQELVQFGDVGVVVCRKKHRLTLVYFFKGGGEFCENMQQM